MDELNERIGGKAAMSGIAADGIMRREFIYPHRSVRSFPISWARLLTALGMAAFLTAGVARGGSDLLAAHGGLTHFILEIAGIPSKGMTSIAIYPLFAPVTAPDLPFPQHRDNPVRTAVLFAASLAALIIVHRTVPLARSFLVFPLVLLCTAAAVVVFTSSFRFTSAMYEQTWMRGEILVWLLLPWVSAFLFILSLPSLRIAIASAFLIQAYAVIWSAVRLAFCLGVFYYTGILFLPLLWFCLGVLFDLVYILVFYSVALDLSLRAAAGRGKP